jgi:hypothetical protein
MSAIIAIAPQFLSPDGHDSKENNPGGQDDYADERFPSKSQLI